MAGVSAGGRMKRCKIDLPTIRISKPGYDVDTAAMENMLFHESFLFTQPYFFTFVPCPFGSGASGVLDQTVSVTVPNVTSDPIVLLFASGGSTVNVFPSIRSIGAGSDASGYNISAWIIGHNVVSSTRVDVNFIKPFRSLSAPTGAYMILMRKP